MLVVSWPATRAMFDANIVLMITAIVRITVNTGQQVRRRGRWSITDGESQSPQSWAGGKGTEVWEKVIGAAAE